MDKMDEIYYKDKEWIAFIRRMSSGFGIEHSDNWFESLKEANVRVVSKYKFEDTINRFVNNRGNPFIQIIRVLLTN